jgi:aminopeptidase N
MTKKIFIRILVCILVFELLSAMVWAQGNAARPTDSGGVLSAEQAAFDVKAYELWLTVDPAKQFIKGAVRVTARIVKATDKFVLDLDTPLQVTSVSLMKGKKQDALKFTRTEKQILIDLPSKQGAGKTIDVMVGYEGTPRVAPNAPWVGGFVWKQTKDGKPWFATAVQNDGADLWFPVKDHPSDEADTALLHFTVPEGLVAASNGKLVSVERVVSGMATYNWKISNPINNYNIALNVAPYKLIEDTVKSVGGETIPIQFYILPEHFEKGQELINQTKDALKFMEQYVGPYPFRNEKIGIAETPYIAMEHQTITAYGGKFEYGAQGYDWTQFHEFGHEWWGNLVTASDWRDFWIHEGFQSFFDAFYQEKRSGREGFVKTLPNRIKFLKNLKPVAPREPRTTTEMYFLPPDYTKSDNDIYGKGALILNSLRFLLGDKAFFRSVRRMAYPDPKMEKITNGKQTRLVTTDDFLRIAEKESGRDLDWFFELYLRQPALPKLSANRVTVNGGTEPNDNLILRWETPNNMPFTMPVEIKIGDEIKRVEMTNGTAVVMIPRAKQYVIDPNGWLLKELDK